MIRFVLQKLLYGFLVLFGVITSVFFLFNLAPGDPARTLAGENASEETLLRIRRKLDLDLGLGERYALYLNDLSPLSIHATADSTARTFFSKEKYSGVLIFSGDQKGLALKWPFLKRSFLSDKNVSELLGEVIPGTVFLAVLSIALALIFGLALGVVAALQRDTVYDRLILMCSAIGMAGPSFFVAIIVAWIGAVLWRDQVTLPLGPFITIVVAYFIFAREKKTQALWKALIWGTSAWIIIAAVLHFVGYFSWALLPLHLPGTGLNMTGSLYSVDVYEGEYLDLRNAILPVITLMIRPLAVIVQLTRSSLLEVMAQDYIRTARAKGLSETRIIIKHALRNALNPVVTAVSGWFASLLAGAVFVEFVFGWKGLGQELFTAIEKQDLPVVMGGVIVIAFAFVVINLIVDIIYGWIDPRVSVR